MTARRDIDQLSRTPANHFRLHAYAAVLALRELLPEPPLEFLSGYYEQVDLFEPPSWWRHVYAWEHDIRDHLPLRALRTEYDLDPLALTLLFTAGLVHEDGRFGQLFETLNAVAGETRPTIGTLSAWTDDERARASVHGLVSVGLLEPARGAVEVPSVLWEAMRGGAPAVPWARYRPPEELPGLSDLVLSDELAAAVARVPGLLDVEDPRPLVVRGPRSSGRRTAVAAIARALGRGLLELEDPAAGGPLLGPLAVLMHALPLVVLDPAPGESVALPHLHGYPGPTAAVAGRSGAVRAERALTLRFGIPDVRIRDAHWRAALAEDDLARTLAWSLRTTSGTIRRLADLARAEAVLAGREWVCEDDVRAAHRALESQELETLASRVACAGGWEDIAVGGETARELELLERRCREREDLHEKVGSALGSQLTAGVRALFSGPTGTGKSLAARALAAALAKDLFCVNLATVVNKYLGETEKNLDAVLSRAEELDVVLLLDEGDALMSRRTDVTTSNDRYANLETNFLLQRLESYEGLLVVTTNAGERIDAAFRRRFDVVVDFRAPDAGERWAIWQLHLPTAHAAEDAFLDEVAARCELTGGQIRNAVLHASLLALADGGVIGAAHIDMAVRREYRKAGAVCPLRGVLVGG